MFLNRRLVLLLIICCFLLSACLQGNSASTPTANTVITFPQATATNTAPAATADLRTTPIPSADTPAPAPTETVPPRIDYVEQVEAVELALDLNDVVLYPVPAIYEGDIVTFQVLPDVPPSLRPNDIDVHIYLDGNVLVEGSLLFRNLAGQSVGLYEWVWDTSGLTGLHELRVILDPDDVIQDGDVNLVDNEVTLEVVVNPERDRPVAESDARWVTTTTDSAIIHVVSGTAAHRDIQFITGIVDAAIQQASLTLGEAPAEKLTLYLIERVIGQGGYAGGVMVISYLDRDYAGDGFYEVLVHESVHLIDRQFARNRIPFLGEGVAVWATGGHYKQENIEARSAALVHSGIYIPLPELIDDFYPVQHEIGYLEAAGFTQYLIDQYGWEQYKLFYSDFEMESGETESGAVDRSLQSFFGLSLQQLEDNWLAHLATLPVSQPEIDDLLMTVRYYNVMRDYQVAYDPTAYYLQAWLPSPGDAATLGVTADFIRHPQEPVNVTLETMLSATDRALRSKDYHLAAVLLDSVEQVLQSNTFADPLSRTYMELVQQVEQFGFEAQEINLNGTAATVVATPIGATNLLQLRFDLNEGMWVLAT